MESEEKKNFYLIENLKEEVCEYWCIDKNSRSKYHIVDNKFNIYGRAIKVFDIHSKAIEAGFYNYCHLELLDIQSIFEENNSENAKKHDLRLNNLNNKNYVNNDIDNNIQNNRNINILAENEIFISEIEDYINFYRQIEAILLLFKIDHEAKKLEADKLADIDIKTVTEYVKNEKAKEINVDRDNIDTEEAEEIENQRIEEVTKFRIEKHNKIIEKHKNKPENAIYMSLFDIYKFRFVKFWLFFFSLFFAISFFLKTNLEGTLDINTQNDMIQFLTTLIFFNPLYKNFLTDPNDYSTQNINKAIKSKSDLLVYLDIVLNNLLMSEFNNETEKYSDETSNYFKRKDTNYEILYAIKLSFMSTSFENYKSSSTRPKTLYPLNTEQISNLYYINEYSLKTEEYSPKLLKVSNVTHDLLIKYEKEICNSCFSNGKIKFSKSSQNNTFIIHGQINDYIDGAYTLFINPNILDKAAVDAILMIVKDVLINNNDNVLIKLNLNIIHVYLLAICSFTILFEVNQFDNLFGSLDFEILDTGTNDSNFYSLICLTINIQIVFLIINMLFNIISKWKMKHGTKKISYFEIYFDFIILCLYAYLLHIENKIDSL